MRMQREIPDPAPRSGTETKSNQTKQHDYWASSVEKYVPALAIATFLVGNSAAALGFLDQLSFDLAMPILIICGITSSLVAFYLMGARLRDHDV